MFSVFMGRIAGYLTKENEKQFERKYKNDLRIISLSGILNRLLKNKAMKLNSLLYFYPYKIN
jgi:hypothetical protein